jgi:hypothetical protein
MLIHIILPWDLIISMSIFFNYKLFSTTCCNQKERVRKTHSTSIVINEPRRPCLLIYFTHTELQSFSRSIYRLALSYTPHRSKIYRHDNMTDLRYSSSASLIHTCIRQGNFLIAFTNYVQSPKAQAFFTSEGSQNNSSSVVLPFFLSFSL